MVRTVCPDISATSRNRMDSEPRDLSSRPGSPAATCVISQHQFFPSLKKTKQKKDPLQQRKDGFKYHYPL